MQCTKKDNYFMNLSVEAIVSLIASLPGFLSAFLFYRQNRLHPDKIFKWLSLAWGLYSVYYLLTGLGFH